jgi:hypothetical protein
VESVILLNAFLALRRRLGIKSRRRKKKAREKDYELMTQGPDGKTIKLRLPLDDHPTVLFFVLFNPPGLMALGPSPLTGPIHTYVHQFESASLAKRQGLDNIVTPSFDTLVFSQMLAKIAHCYAAWRIGRDKFKPYLREFIRREYGKADDCPERYQWIGGFPKLAAPADPDVLHQLGHGFLDTNGKRLLYVTIRLLANLSGPIYTVVVGEMI